MNDENSFFTTISNQFRLEAEKARIDLLELKNEIFEFLQNSRTNNLEKSDCLTDCFKTNYKAAKNLSEKLKEEQSRPLRRNLAIHKAHSNLLETHSSSSSLALCNVAQQIRLDEICGLRRLQLNNQSDVAQRAIHQFNSWITEMNCMWNTQPSSESHRFTTHTNPHEVPHDDAIGSQLMQTKQSCARMNSLVKEARLAIKQCGMPGDSSARDASSRDGSKTIRLALVLQKFRDTQALLDGSQVSVGALNKQFGRACRSTQFSFGGETALSGALSRELQVVRRELRARLRRLDMMGGQHQQQEASEGDEEVERDEQAEREEQRSREEENARRAKSAALAEEMECVCAQLELIREQQSKVRQHTRWICDHERAKIATMKNNTSPDENVAPAL